MHDGVVGLLDDDRGAGVELLSVRRLPPVVHVPGRVVLAALVVEPVRDLVPDDRADRAEVDGWIGGGVEKRGLKNRRREDNLVQHRVVIRVDLLRRHEPALAVDRGVDARQHAFVLEHLRGAGVGIVGRLRGELQGGVVFPLIRVSNLNPETGHLLQRLFLR